MAKKANTNALQIKLVRSLIGAKPDQVAVSYTHLDVYKRQVLDYSPLSKVEPEKSLLAPLKKNAGRNSYGRITVRHRGGGNRRKYRIIDFKRNKADIPAKVLTLEYDPNRSAHIALVQYEDGEKRYILAPQGLKVGDTVVSGADVDIRPGNALPLSSIPTGTFDHNVKLYPGKGAPVSYTHLYRCRRQGPPRWAR